jgi:hypothetical protein
VSRVPDVLPGRHAELVHALGTAEMVILPFVLDFLGRVRADFHATDGIRERLVAPLLPMMGTVPGSMSAMVFVSIVEVGDMSFMVKPLLITQYQASAAHDDRIRG